MPYDASARRRWLSRSRPGWSSKSPSSSSTGATPAAATVPRRARFPRTLIRVGEAAEIRVIEVIAGPSGPGRALVVPVAEKMLVEDRGRLSYVLVQDLGASTWHLGRIGATVGQDGSLGRSPTAWVATTTVAESTRPPSAG